MINADIILLIILGGFVLYGLWFGLIQTLGGLVGVIVGSLLASRMYIPIAAWITDIFGVGENLSKVIAFIIIFVIIQRLVGFIFYLVDRIFKFISIIPFLKSLNRLAGAVLGFIEGALVIGAILFFVAQYPISETIENSLQESQVANRLVRSYRVLSPLLPQELRDFDPSDYFHIPLPEEVRGAIESAANRAREAGETVNGLINSPEETR